MSAFLEVSRLDLIHPVVAFLTHRHRHTDVLEAEIATRFMRRSTQDVVEWRHDIAVRLHPDREILSVTVSRVEHPEHDPGLKKQGHVAKSFDGPLCNSDAIGEVRAAILLVFLSGLQSQRLQEVLLRQAQQHTIALPAVRSKRVSMSAFSSSKLPIFAAFTGKAIAPVSFKQKNSVLDAVAHVCLLAYATRTYLSRNTFQ